MDLYQTLVDAFNQLIEIFPEPLQWLATLAILAGLAYGFFMLIQANALFLILLVILMPAILPIVGGLVADMYQFFLFLLQRVGIKV